MYGTSFFYNTRVNVGGFYFDASLGEDHNLAADITDHPIEVGANVTDNVVIQQAIVTLNVAVGSIYSITPFFSFVSANRPVDALQQLRQLQVNRTPIEVICRLARYESMLIQNIKVSQAKETATSAYFTITLKEAFIVNATGGSIYNNPSSSEYSNGANEGTKQAEQA